MWLLDAIWLGGIWYVLFLLSFPYFPSFPYLLHLSIFSSINHHQVIHPKGLGRIGSGRALRDLLKTSEPEADHIGTTRYRSSKSRDDGVWNRDLRVLRIRLCEPRGEIPICPYVRSLPHLPDFITSPTQMKLALPTG